MSAVTIFLFLAAISAFSFSTVEAHGDCKIGTFRITGASSFFTLVCQCDNEYRGRTFRFLDPDTPDTNAQEALTVSCIEKRKSSMAHACDRSVKSFQQMATHALRNCMNLRPKNPSGNGLKPFTYSTDNCKSEFRDIDTANVEAWLVCGCTQRPGYVVHPGVIQFLTDGSPNGAKQEQKFLRDCTGSALPALSNSCISQPERFGLRGRQLFNVCCKRLRVKFSAAKLKCQAVVPDDVSNLGAPYGVN